MNDASSGALANSGPAPPPPPPPPGAGQVPALRISTASDLGPRRIAAGQQQQQQEGYEPPAAIQNAMMTKDKKPFTYTPGMGGKLDLSQIRSPRMARRVAKNANDEGIEGPPKVLDQEASSRSPGTPPQPQPSMYSPPQVAVAVFPQGGPQLGSVSLRNSCLPRNPVGDRQEQPAVPRPTVRVECRPADVQQQQQQQTPTPPTSPTQVTLAKAPTPWMQRQTSKEQELPEWARRAGGRSSQESTPGADGPQPRQITFANPPSPPSPQPAPAPRPLQQSSVPRRIEDRPSVFTAINEPGHHQFSNSNPHHVSRWGNPVGQSGYQPQGGAYIVPVQVDCAPTQQPYQQNNHYHQNQNQMQQHYRNAPDNRANVQRAYTPMASQQAEPGPLQSQSFRVLQKITDTYNPDQVDGEQLRKLQLTEDDRYLMNKFKEQVDGEQYLHQEEDPRYRGAAIPSRAFRYLQTMTDSADVPNSTSRPANSVAKKSNRHSNTFEEVPIQPYIPASQQQVQEPKKYTGSAIPSRSFRILQQMTTPESIATEIAQESATTRDSTATQLFDMPFNQQSVYSAAIPIICQSIPMIPCTCYYYPLPFQNEVHHSYPNFYVPSSSACLHHHSSNCYRDITIASCCHGHPHTRNSSALYLGCPWRCYSSTMATDQSDRCVFPATEERSVTSSLPRPPSSSSSSPSSFLADDHDDHHQSTEKYNDSHPARCYSVDSDDNRDLDNEVEIVEEEEEEDEDEEHENEQDGEEDVEMENSSDSSCDSESYWAYSTGLNPLSRQKDTSTEENIEQQTGRSDEEDSDSTDCGKVSQFEDDSETDKNDEEKEESNSCDEEAVSTTVSVDLPLRFKCSVVLDENEDTTRTLVGSVTDGEEIETHVNFTLKRASSRDIPEAKDSETTASLMATPTFIVTTSEATNIAETEEEVRDNEGGSSEALLRVRNNSKEEITDDEDSGVTSDLSRIISEADTDSECCLQTNEIEPVQPSVTRRFANKSKKYGRTQTHSRLFKLLSDEQQLLSPSQPVPMVTTETSSIDSLPARPKSLDCEALLRTNYRPLHYSNTTDPTRYSALPQPQIYPRRNVYCPRTNSAKNIPRIFNLNNQQLQSCTRSSNHSNATSIPSNIPTPIRLNKRC